MHSFNKRNLTSSASLYFYKSNLSDLKTIYAANKDTHEQNKYFAFDSSIHATLAAYNRISGDEQYTFDTLQSLFKDNWFSSGYPSKTEEEKFFRKGLIMLSHYFINRLDEGRDSLIINKVLSMQIHNQISVSLWARIDKVLEHDDGSLEIVDYKSGRNINHIPNFNLDLRSIVYALLVHNKFGILPIHLSYYYLSCNKKFTSVICSDDIPKLYDCLSKLVLIDKRY